MPYYSAVQNPSFEPAVTDILAITNSNPASVTTGAKVNNIVTAVPHNYLTGLIVRMQIPQSYGMRLDYGPKQPHFQITVTGPTTFTIPLDTTNFDPFVVPVEMMGQPLLNVSQAVPMGEIAEILTQSVVNVLTPQF